MAEGDFERKGAAFLAAVGELVRMGFPKNLGH